MLARVLAVSARGRDYAPSDTLGSLQQTARTAQALSRFSCKDCFLSGRSMRGKAQHGKERKKIPSHDLNSLSTQSAHGQGNTSQGLERQPIALSKRALRSVDTASMPQQHSACQLKAQCLQIQLLFICQRVPSHQHTHSQYTSTASCATYYLFPPVCFQLGSCSPRAQLIKPPTTVLGSLGMLSMVAKISRRSALGSDMPPPLVGMPRMGPSRLRY